MSKKTDDDGTNQHFLITFYHSVKNGEIESISQLLERLSDEEIETELLTLFGLAMGANNMKAVSLLLERAGSELIFQNVFHMVRVLNNVENIVATAIFVEKIETMLSNQGFAEFLEQICVNNSLIQKVSDQLANKHLLPLLQRVIDNEDAVSSLLGKASDEVIQENLMEIFEIAVSKNNLKVVSLMLGKAVDLEVTKMFEIAVNKKNPEAASLILDEAENREILHEKLFELIYNTAYESNSVNAPYLSLLLQTAERYGEFETAIDTLAAYVIGLQEMEAAAEDYANYLNGNKYWYPKMLFVTSLAQYGLLGRVFETLKTLPKGDDLLAIFNEVKQAIDNRKQ